MAFFFGFGTPEDCKIAYDEVWTFWVLPMTYKTSKVQTSNASYDFQQPQIQKNKILFIISVKQKTKFILAVSMKFSIGRANSDFEIFQISYAKMPRVRPPDSS